LQRPVSCFYAALRGGDSPRKMAYSCSLPVRNAAMHRAKASALLHPICPHCLGCKFGGSRTETAKSIRLSLRILTTLQEASVELDDTRRIVQKGKCRLTE